MSVIYYHGTRADLRPGELLAAGYDGFIGYEYDPAYRPEHTREGIA